jgi:lysophospholipase L1-like esterase
VTFSARPEEFRPVQWRLALIAVVLASLLSAVLAVTWHTAPPVAPAAPESPSWSTTWATAPAAAEPGVTRGRAGATFRNVVHTSIGGSGLRVRLSNRFGTAPVRFAHVTVARSAHLGGRWDGSVDPSDGTADPATMRDVTFGGATEVTLAPGAEVAGDPVGLSVAADVDLLVSAWTPDPSGTVTFHRFTRQKSFYSAGPADQAAAAAGAAFGRRTSSWYYLSAVEVTGGPGTVVALGDSITDGAGASVGLNRRWPDYLAARLAGSTWPHYGVANAGISGNRVLDVDAPGGVVDPSGRSAEARLQDDVLARSGVRTVIIAEGINDILRQPHQRDPALIIAGLRQLAERCHADGVRVIVATLAPWQGWPDWTPQLDAVREAVNAWIRGGGDGSFDGVADFDQVLRDPVQPLRMAPRYDSGDHLHPGDEGLAALAGAIPLDRL